MCGSCHLPSNALSSLFLFGSQMYTVQTIKKFHLKCKEILIFFKTQWYQFHLSPTGQLIWYTVYVTTLEIIVFARLELRYFHSKLIHPYLELNHLHLLCYGQLE